ncbi:MAG: hypothetical protein M1426_04830 [Patescibacteria group bacterium]|nr:hypothetical protein [Patescibacteria group bacterium]
MSDTKLKTYDETFDLPLESYEVTDIDGKIVTVNTKTIGKHQSNSHFEQWAPVHFNIGWILQNPDKVTISTSNARQAIENRKRGVVKVYKKENFLIGLDLPSVSTSQRDETQVVVLYEEETKKNFTLTYSIYVK